MIVINYEIFKFEGTSNYRMSLWDLSNSLIHWATKWINKKSSIQIINAVFRRNGGFPK